MGFRTGFSLANSRPSLNIPNETPQATSTALMETPSSSPKAAAPQEKLATAEDAARFVKIKRDLHRQLIESMDLSVLGKMDQDQLRTEVREAASLLLDKFNQLITLDERNRLISEVIDETFGLGPLESLMSDPSISEIMVNGPKTTFIERAGKIERANIVFNDDKHLIQIIQRIVGRVGRRVDETTPLADARLADGSRVNAVVPPIALDGALLTIRRFGKRAMKPEDLVEKGAMTNEMLEFLASCIKARINIIISGGTGSGKTTLLNALSSYIAHDERIATIEDAAELRLQQPHVVRMETRPPNIEGNGQILTRDLVKNALRMRPDRVIVGECRGGEALDMLQAMNTGHDGSMTTIHANDTRDALSRLEMMVGMNGFDIPIWIVRRQIVSAVQIVIQANRLPGGLRKITKISEIVGMEEEVVSMQDIFMFKQTGVDENRVCQGYHMSTGIRPKCLDKLNISGVGLPIDMFQQRRLGPA